MMDWNGNGRLDPVDVGISIATGEFLDEEEVSTPPMPQKRAKPKRPSGLWGWLGRRFFQSGADD